MKITITQIAATIAFLVAAQLPSHAFAEAPVRSSTVSLAGLDLSTAEDAATALNRIERAAGDVCGQSFSRRYGMTGAAFRACRSETVAATVERMDQPMVTAAYEAEYGAAPMQVAAND